MRSDRALAVMLVALAMATLVHHAHNASYLDHYPEMPAWLSPTLVWLFWIGSTAVGVLGYLMLRRGYRLAGSALLIAYGCYGLDSLAHYAVAPLSAHTATMNLTIWLEAAAGVGLLVACAISLRRKASSQ